MTDTLSDLLRGAAGTASNPRVDVDALVRRADGRVRRRRLATTATSAVVVGAVVGVSLLAQEGGRTDPAPAPPSSPSPSVVDPDGEAPASSTRPLVYAEGSTIHAADREITANARVQFVDTTDDGVVFMTGLDRRVWFDDGSGAEVIGESRSLHVGNYLVYTGNPGSLVVWSEGIGRTPDLVVYDTSQMAEVARIDDNNSLLGVGTQALYLSPDWSNTPGCWIQDEGRCPDPSLLRFDVATGRTETITRDAYEAELRGNPRMFEGARGDSDNAPRVAVAPLGATFTRAGHRLVPTDASLSRTSGEPVELRWTSPGGDAVGFWAVQWLDDDRVVLAGYEEDEGGPSGIGQGDSYAASYVDLLVCTLSTGGCDEVVPLDPATPYVTPGRNTF